MLHLALGLRVAFAAGLAVVPGLQPVTLGLR